MNAVMNLPGVTEWETNSQPAQLLSAPHEQLYYTKSLCGILDIPIHSGAQMNTCTNKNPSAATFFSKSVKDTSINMKT